LEVKEMKRAGWCLGLLMALVTVGVAQVPTVDNFTLEKYQKQRIAAQRDYQENYARMGFPSPEELDRQREADMSARLQLADQLRQARLEEQRIDIQRRGLELQAASMEDARQQASEAAAYYGGQQPGYVEGYGSGYGGYYPNSYGAGGYYNNGRFGNGRLGRYRDPYGFNGVWPVLGGYRATPVGAYPTNSGVPLPFIRNTRRGPGHVRHYWHK
jgi:hypothetical protein